MRAKIVEMKFVRADAAAAAIACRWIFLVLMVWMVRLSE